MEGLTALRPSLRWTAAPAASLAVLAVGVWVISPRFSITGPSLIDDWGALLYAPGSIRALVHFDYPIAQRFRPAWDLWNWLQWRTPGAPADMLGPNLAAVGRLALLIAGMTTFALIVVPRGGKSRLEHALLCALPALVVVTVPAFGQDLARFGPEEPALVGGMTLGGSLMYWGGKELAAAKRLPIRAFILFGLGFVAWSYGIFQKETSVCALLALGLAIPFARQLRPRLTPKEMAVGLTLTGFALLPLLGMLYEVVRIVLRGSLVYGTHVKTSGGALDVFAHALRRMRFATQSVAGYAMLSFIALFLVADLWRRRVDWIELAIVAIALASLEMSMQTGYYESRYYLPAIALLAIAAARAAVQLPAIMVRGVIVVVTGLALVSSESARSTVRYWAAGDQVGNELVASVRAHTNNGCNLTIAGVDPERTRSIEELVRFRDGPVNCSRIGRYVVLGPSARLPQRCAPNHRLLGEWEVSHLEVIRLVRCGYA